MLVSASDMTWMVFSLLFQVPCTTSEASAASVHSIEDTWGHILSNNLSSDVRLRPVFAASNNAVSRPVSSSVASLASQKGC